MPLKLLPPRPGKSPNYYIRGTHLGRYVDESTGTALENLARKALVQRKSEIERGRFSDDIDKPKSGPTFLEAAITYIETGGESRFLGRFDPETGKWDERSLIAHFGDTPIADITSQEIAKAAVKLLPEGTPQTRNRQVYTPVSAVLKAAGLKIEIERPKGWRGSKRTTWLRPDEAFRLFKAADKKDPEFGIFLRVLTYTGMRLSECTGMLIDQLELTDAFAYVPTTKNGEPRGIHLPPILIAELANHPRGLNRKGQRVFRFRKSGRLYTWLDEILADSAITLPPRTGFHVLRHTWATWMRRYGGLDTRGLVGTGAWADEASAARYEHVVASEEAKRADLLPTERRIKAPRGKA
jgi:integrase